MLSFKTFYRPYVELVNFLLSCGDEAQTWVGRRLQVQCTQHWGVLCDSFSSRCLLGQSDPLLNSSALSVAAPTLPGPSQHSTEEPELESMSVPNLMDNKTESAFIKINVTSS